MQIGALRRVFCLLLLTDAYAAGGGGGHGTGVGPYMMLTP